MLSNGRRESRRQECPMLRYHARRGVSAVAVQAALLASSSGVFAQSSTAVLPPVTVDAPAVAKPKPRKPAVNTAAIRSRSARPASERAAPAVASEQGAGGTHPSLDPPGAVARYQLPQRSFSITAKEVDETITLKEPEDAVKYMPSLFVRKRTDGDNQAALATRRWALN